VTRRRFYAPPEDFTDDGKRVVLSPDESRHLRDVLRLRAGDEAHVFDGEGREFACAVVEARGRASALEVFAPVEPQRPESPLDLTLAVALLKGEKFDLVVQKATELGASRVAPVVTARADVRLRDERDAARRVERWRRLALEAAKQSGRARIPAVAEPCAFDTFVKSETRAAVDSEPCAVVGSEAGASAEGARRGGSLRVFFAERGGDRLDSLADAARRGAPSTEIAPHPIVAALVGPEGGWDDEEIDLAREHGWSIVTLGGRTLRAETAALTACVLLQHLFGDLK
jgi:16S rRNA (uracil1498-N3)-methyltransferase